MSVLEARGLSFSYGDDPVFEDVSFSIGRGQVFCLVGPNGCGKTTLSHCVLGHMKPQSGAVIVEGNDISGLPARELAARIAYVPQNHVRSFPYRSVDVVAMGRTRHQRFLDSGAQHVEQALAVMRQLGIDHLAETEYTTLSGGELQMVLIARALVQDADILVLDEPTAHLDVKRTQSLLLLLADLAKVRGMTILLSTHDFNYPLMLADEGVDVRMALMEGGALSEAGEPLELLSSGLLDKVYDIRSKVVEIQGEPVRHYLAVWSERAGR